MSINQIAIITNTTNVKFISILHFDTFIAIVFNIFIVKVLHRY